MRGPSPAITAKDVRAMLAVRYAPPEWRIEHELTLNVRRLDTVALRMWGGSGRGYEVLGFEIKVSRADWLRELTSIEKAAEWAHVVDRFFVVAPKGVVQEGELPRDWGLLEVTGTGTGLRLKAQPAPRPVGATLPRELTARLLTRDHYQRRAESAEEQARVRAEAYEKGREAVATELEVLRAIAAKHAALLRDAGLGSYRDPASALRTAQRVADALAALDQDWFRWTLTRITDGAAKTAAAAKELQEAVAEFRAPLATEPSALEVTA